MQPLFYLTALPPPPYSQCKEYTLELETLGLYWSYWGSFSLLWFSGRSRREVDLPDGMRWANGYALTARLALLKVNVAEIILDSDSIKWASLLAFSAPYAGHTARLFSRATFVFVDAGYEYPPVLRVLLSHFYHMLRADLGASTACCTFILIHNWKQSLGVHVNRVKIAHCAAIAHPEAAPLASCITFVERRRHSAGISPVIPVHPGPFLWTPCATHHGNHRILSLRRLSYDSRDCGHNLVTPYRAKEVRYIASFHKGIGESSATWIAAPSAICSWHGRLYLVDARVFYHFKFL